MAKTFLKFRPNINKRKSLKTIFFIILGVLFILITYFISIKHSNSLPSSSLTNFSSNMPYVYGFFNYKGEKKIVVGRNSVLYYNYTGYRTFLSYYFYVMAMDFSIKTGFPLHLPDTSNIALDILSISEVEKYKDSIDIECIIKNDGEINLCFDEKLNMGIIIYWLLKKQHYCYSDCETGALFVVPNNTRKDIRIW
jgi:hypothetical protein